jgi:hypothetical protein
MAAQGTWIAVLAVQFLPFIPFSALNFLLGATPLSWPTFLWTLAASVVPADLVLVALGRSLAEGRTAVYWTLAACVLLGCAGAAGRRWFARAWRLPDPQRCAAPTRDDRPRRSTCGPASVGRAQTVSIPGCDVRDHINSTES